MIYFAQLETGVIKIGYTKDIDVRLGELERYYGPPVSLLYTMPGDRAVEHEMHVRFAHLRFGRTEQFRPGLELMEFIGRPLLVGANPDAVEVVETLKAVRLLLPIPMHKELRVLAAQNDTNMSALARLAVEELLARREGKSK